jgi:hypothetical protein
LIYVLFILLALAMSIFSTITARKEYLHKVEIGYGVGEGEIKWNFA